jgi:Tol biopolymer transport system component
MPLTAGQTLSFYQVLGPLGAGAMGEVWRARDTRLDREVALKVLPDQLAGDETRLRRFEREARLLASLNHPNVAQVYGIDQVGDTCLMAMELVPGTDLGARLARGPLPVTEALEVCRQIAEGVEAAHEAGVIHRDLKPANVCITPNGTVKVLDFGLARPWRTGPAGGAGETLLASLTGEGMLVGTPAYLSPEAVRGQPVDRRADVWAFGCILHECLTGERTFQADSLADQMVAIVQREPDLSRLPAGTPARVRRLLARCLDKNPRTRLQDVGEARIALDGSGAGADADGGDDEAGAGAAGRRSRAGLGFAVLLTGALGAAAIVVASRPDPEPPGLLAGATFHRLTDSVGTEFDVDISPDGDFVAFGSDRDGQFDVWLAPSDGGEPRNLTQGRFTIFDDAIRNLGFDGKGANVWFMTGTEGRVMSVPITGGAFEPLFGPWIVDMDWTRDGRRIVYHTSESGDPTFVRDVDAPAGEPILRAQEGMHLHFPVWSTDERWIYLVKGVMTTADRDLWRVRPDGGALERLTFEQKAVAFPTPIDADTVLFVAQEPDGSGPWLWSLDVPSRQVKRLTVGLEQYTSVAASADGRRLVATLANPKAALWRVPVRPAGAPVATQADAEPLPGVPSVRALAPRFAGDELFYLSSRGSGDGLWMLRDGRAREVWSGTREPLVYLPSVSPDGTRAALVRRHGERLGLSILDVEGRQIVQDLQGPVDVRGSSTWSPAGDAIVIAGIGPDGEGLFRFPLDGGPAVQLVSGKATDPVWSPAGDLIVYSGRQVGPMLPLEAVRADGTPVELTPGGFQLRVAAEWVRFLPDGSGLVYLSGSSFTPEFWLLDLATRESRQLAVLDELGMVRSFDVTPDGTTIVFDRVQQDSDVVLIELGEG